MKNYSYYHFMKTKQHEPSSIGQLSEYIINDSSFPKHEKSYHVISDYLEKNPYENISLSVFDNSYQEYENWLNH